MNTDQTLCVVDVVVVFSFEVGLDDLTIISNNEFHQCLVKSLEMCVPSRSFNVSRALLSFSLWLYCPQVDILRK